MVRQGQASKDVGAVMIKFRCSSCNQKIGVPDEYGDKNVRCPKCHDVILVPSATVDEISIKITHDDNSTQNKIPDVSPIANEPVLDTTDEEDDTSSENSIIHFKCSSCGKDMEAPEALRGKTLLCDGCGIEVEVSENNSHESEEEIETLYKIKSLTKACPYCGEEILAVAKKCKHCGEFLEGNETQTHSSVCYDRDRHRSSGTENREWSRGKYALLVIATLLIPLIGICAGIYGLTHKGKEKQGTMLLVGAIGVMILYYGWVGV